MDLFFTENKFSISKVEKKGVGTAAKRPTLSRIRMHIPVENICRSLGFITIVRHYCPRMERFISEDPIGFSAGDPNFYRYVGNSPISSNDPSGNGSVLGGVCLLIDVAYNAGTSIADSATHSRNAVIYQEQINDTNHIRSQDKSCSSLDGAKYDSQISLLEKQKAYELTQTSNAALGAIGGSLMGSLVCGGLLLLPTP